MRSYSHLSDDERDQIGILRAAGRSTGAIARALGRAKTTISRELQVFAASRRYEHPRELHRRSSRDGRRTLRPCTLRQLAASVSLRA